MPETVFAAFNDYYYEIYHDHIYKLNMSEYTEEEIALPKAFPAEFEGATFMQFDNAIII